ncbi:MAG TPA: DUF3119 domain-containing protein [Cyanobacteria bacterium UBA11149]|nr:DUF3119 domain-containing protein [Cyanobacteria bacterium UBA11367]HBE55999.1 DUF3119 domain-containing protein [Cyanobacteria bacterium UBA11366]HBK66125.1 DUF3119 domain-containing protein [Cyanobacteria bacterium UBA11166]HBR74059.1 DUF3119 domain-containing protein [Cyanobacteria bacterium UBA11159]HBS68379.1 DUF3119 domain-containing protein [Cyanobacteria bacterium UBA11153]HBW89978.1 DUF3119 domain-containing protein [Cyanobacteria bacterium UBA11149]HCA94141.1 DUF3119 domain-conta
MTSTTSPGTPTQIVELSPSYALPLALILMGIPMILLKIWMGFAIAVFGLFLMFQAITLRLQFTDTALDIYRSETLIRRFPYQDWSNWRIFWTPVPILFYFKEVKSIHFLPIIFDPKTLQNCLEQRCPRN